MLTGRVADINAAVALLLKSPPHWRVDGDRLRLHNDAGNALTCQLRTQEQVFGRR
jgi:hypothetical protein